jgi:hypothetical protein
MAEEKKSFLDSVKSFFANAWAKTKAFFGKLIIKLKAVDWKELWHEGTTKIVNPVIAYCSAGGVLLIAILIGILCI